MITATFNRYYECENHKHEVQLRGHVTISGKEDHFALAQHDAQMILLGMQTAFPTAGWTLVKIDMGY